MKRVGLTPRAGWQGKVEAAGLVFHSPAGMDEPYWNEAAAYEFTAREIDTLEAAGNTMQEMCLKAAQHVIDRKRYAELEIPAAAVPVIELAWEQEPPALYGRFDFAWGGERSGGAPKLLEYNADTPTSLMEAAVIQWDWLKDMTPQLGGAASGGDVDQFNSIHDKLIAKWKDLKPYLQQPVYFAGVDEPEDQLTLVYLRDTAQQAGHETLQMFMEEIGWNADRQAFVDPAEDQMFSVFKLYPWEAMLAEEFGPAALGTYQGMRWIEPIWKMLLANKGILPILWELFPGHELLLEAHFEAPAVLAGAPQATAWSDAGSVFGGGSALQTASGMGGMRNYCSKPLLSREGANVTIVRNGAITYETRGSYSGKRVRQALAPDAPLRRRAGTAAIPCAWGVDGGSGVLRDGRPGIADAGDG